MDAVAFAMIDALPATAPVVGWQTLVNANQRSAAATSTDGTRIYYSHGLTSASAVTSMLNIVTTDGQILAGPTASVARQGVAGAWCNGKHYAIGGATSSFIYQTVEAYTPAGTNGASGVWSTIAALPAQRANASAAVIGNLIYVAGGSEQQSGGTGTSASAKDTLFRYDPTANTWSTLASMPAARTQGALVAVGSKLYYLGGVDSSGVTQPTVYIFDTAAGTWTTGPALFEEMSNGAASVVNGVAYIYGLYYPTGNSGQGARGLQTYTIATGAGSLYSPQPTGNYANYPGMVTIGSVLYIVSGSGTANVDKLDLGAGTGFTTAVLGVKSLLNPVLSGVGSTLPVTPPTDTTGKAAYAQTVQTLKALAAL